MKGKFVFASLTRISDLAETTFGYEPLSRERWETGDYVVGEVNQPPSAQSPVELSSGRLAEVAEGDFIVGALGIRFATLGVTGDWQGIGEDGHMSALTAAGLMGKVRSRSTTYAPLLSLTYRGHITVDGQAVRMSDFVLPCPERKLGIPIILLVGSSMSAGKTTSAKIIIHQLKEAGLTVIGAKLTGAGRYRDILGMGDAGADHIFDFADVGLPSTVCPKEEFRAALRCLLARIAAIDADVLVAEAGASPLEPYNGATAVEEIEANVRLLVLCASDPYSVLGVREAFGKRPDIVAGLATSTEAGVGLIEKLSGLRAMNLLDRAVVPELRSILKETLGY